MLTLSKMSKSNVLSSIKNVGKLIQPNLKLTEKASSQAVARAQYCMDLVRQYDYENFLCTLLINGGASRNCAFAVRAFNVEMALVQGNVTDSKLGGVRFQFWENVLQKIYSKDPDAVIPEHPVAEELNLAVKRHKLTKLYLQRLLNSRHDRLTNTSYLTISDVDKYVEESVSCVYYLMLEGCNVKNVQADHAASHLGKAQGIVNMLRSLRHIGADRVVPFPQDILLKHGVTQESLIRQSEDRAIQDAVYEVASHANTHLLKARQLSDSVPVEARVLLLPASAIENYLEKLRHAHFKVFDQSLRRRNNSMSFSLFWNKLRHKY